jgi:hypothetical protein
MVISESYFSLSNECIYLLQIGRKGTKIISYLQAKYFFFSILSKKMKKIFANVIFFL